PLIAREGQRSGYSGRADLQDVEVDRVRERVAALLSPTPTPRDEIARLSGAPPPVVFAALVELSLVERAVLLPGGLVASA
ncbi:MAG TPA: DNA-protecting protein DprA, partial [Caulobacteraceae bacterium]